MIEEILIFILLKNAEILIFIFILNILIILFVIIFFNYGNYYAGSMYLLSNRLGPAPLTSMTVNCVSYAYPTCQPAATPGLVVGLRSVLAISIHLKSSSSVTAPCEALLSAGDRLGSGAAFFDPALEVSLFE